MFVDDGVMGFSEMRASVFAAVLLGRKDRRTVVSRCARKTVTLPGDSLGSRESQRHLEVSGDQSEFCL